MREEFIWGVVASVITILVAAVLKDTGTMPATTTALAVIGGTGLIVCGVVCLTDLGVGE